MTCHGRFRSKVLPNCVRVVYNATFAPLRPSVPTHAPLFSFPSTPCETFSTLSYEIIPPASAPPSSDASPVHTLLVFHGLLGSGRNWRGPARLILQRYDELTMIHGDIPAMPRWQAALVDLRCHGKSADVAPPLPGPNSVASAAADVVRLVQSEGWGSPSVVVGHSFGGKVALEYAKSLVSLGDSSSPAPPQQVWALDSVPFSSGCTTTTSSYSSAISHGSPAVGSGSSGGGGEGVGEVEGEVPRVIATLQSMPPIIPSRQWAVDEMLRCGFTPSIAHWVGSNLRAAQPKGTAGSRSGGNMESGNGGMTFQFDLPGAVELYGSFKSADYRNFLSQSLPDPLCVDFVQAENSDRWTPQSTSALQAVANTSDLRQSGRRRAVQLHSLPKAGHWLHLDNPHALVDLIAPSLLPSPCSG